MGGRKSYSNKSYLGNSKEVKKETKVLDDFFDNKEKPENIALQNLKVATLAKKPIKYSVYSIKLFSKLSQNQEFLEKISSKNELREEITKEWNNVRDKFKFRIEKEAEKIIIDSAVKVFGGEK